MRCFLNLFVIFLCISGNAASYKTNDTRNGRFSYLHAIEEDLLHQTWEDQEQPCLQQLLKVIKNVQNSTLWATWIWDSMQFPVGQLYGTRSHLGNYDQCMDFPWTDRLGLKTQYCLAEVTISEIDPDVTNMDIFGSVRNYIRYKTKHSLRYNSLIWGICAPDLCKPESISKFVDAMFKSTHLALKELQSDITVNPEYCQISREKEGMGFSEYFVISFITVLIVMTFLCTIYVGFKGAESKSTVLDLAKAFNIKINAGQLVKVEDQSIRCMLGIRMISVFLILMSHHWIGKNIFGISNAGEIDKKLDDYAQCVRFNADLVVDIFFILSGLLLTTSLLGKEPETFNIFTVIVKRYVRLMTSVVLIILILPMVLLRGDPGPLVKKHLQVEVDTCALNWWRTVLMIGNYGDTEKMCYAVLWSMASDFHLFVIGVVVYWIYIKNRRAGIMAYAVLAVASVLMPVIYGYIHYSPAVIAFDFRTSDSVRKHLISDPMYVRTHLRAGPYFVGIAIGYLMAVYHPDKHRNIISKKLSILSFVVIMTMLTSLLTVSGIYHGRQYGPLEGAAFSVMRRNAIAALVGFFIITCEYGCLPYISSVFSWSGLVFLNKLSYGVYLTHFMLMLRFLSRTRVPLRSDTFDDMYSTFGLLAASTAMSLCIWLFWEAPVINIVDIILKRLTNKIQENYNKENHETNNKDAAQDFKTREKKLK